MEQPEDPSDFETSSHEFAAVSTQVPAPADDVIDQTPDTEVLTQAFRQLTNPDANTIVALSGETGTGTTTLAQIWAQRAHERFPGGQLYIDGAAYTSRDGMALSDAVTDCLLAFGVPNNAIPTHFNDLTQLYWKILDERSPTLVLLDSVTDPAQVRTFAPRNTHSKILVTSRQRMTELQLESAHLVTLAPMSESTSLTLLRGLCGRERIDRDTAAASRLTALCGGLPLDLRIAAAQLVSRPHLTIGAYLSEMDLDAELPVIGHAYQRLTPRAAAFFRRLGAVHGLVSITVPTAGVAGRVNPRHARSLLSELTVAGLLANRNIPQRWAFPPLVAWYALRQTELYAPETLTEVAADLAGYYTVMTCMARRALTGRPVPDDVSLPSKFIDPFTGSHRTSHAIGWLTRERANILAVLYAASRDPLRQAWQLAEALTDMLVYQRHFDEAREAIDDGICAACGDRGPGTPAAQLRLRLIRAGIELDRGRPYLAKDDLDAAVGLAVTVGDPHLSAILDQLRARLV